MLKFSDANDVGVFIHLKIESHPMKTIHAIAEEVAMIGPQIGRRIMADLAQVADIPHAQLCVVMLLFHQGPKHLSDICQQMKVSAPTATGIVTRLEKSGFVSRTADIKDRRAVVVCLTAAGRKLTQKMRAVVVKRWTDIFLKISREDAQKYLEILKKISEAI